MQVSKHIVLIKYLNYSETDSSSDGMEMMSSNVHSYSSSPVIRPNPHKSVVIVNEIMRIRNKRM